MSLVQRVALAAAVAAVLTVADADRVAGTPSPEAPETSTLREGLASWYGGGEPLNERVAMGHRFNPESREAAMWDVPLGTLVKVTNLQNGRSIVVRITDRGPARRLHERVIDLTRGSFEQIAPLTQGLIPVRVDRLS